MNHKSQCISLHVLWRSCHDRVCTSLLPDSLQHVGLVESVFQQLSFLQYRSIIFELLLVREFTIECRVQRVASCFGHTVCACICQFLWRDLHHGYHTNFHQVCNPKSMYFKIFRSLHTFVYLVLRRSSPCALCRCGSPV